MQDRVLFFFALQKFQDKVTSSVCAWCRAHKFFTDVSVLYSFIWWLEKGKKKKQENLPSCTSVHSLFFHPLLWIVRILLISKLLLYHPLFPCATVFVQSFGGLCILFKLFPFPYHFLHFFPSHSLSSPKHSFPRTSSLCLPAPRYCSSSGLYLTFPDYSLSFLLKIVTWQGLQRAHQVF